MRHRGGRRKDDAALRGGRRARRRLRAVAGAPLETTAQGRAFLDATRAAWPCAALDRLVGVWDGPARLSGRGRGRGAGHGIALAPALAAFLQAVAANLVSAGVRLIPLGQTDGQRVLAGLEPVIAGCAQQALACPLDDVGSAAFRADIASMRHETQYTRLVPQ